MQRSATIQAGDGGRLTCVVAGEARKRHFLTGEAGEQTILPGFTLSERGADGITRLNALDDLAAAMPGLLVAAQSW